MYKAANLSTRHERVCDVVCEYSSMSRRFAQVVGRRTSNLKVPGSTPGRVNHRQKALNNYRKYHQCLNIILMPRDVTFGVVVINPI